MQNNEKWTSMNVFLEREEHRKLREISLKGDTFPHRVIVEMVRHLNTNGLPKWLLKACLRGHEISVRKGGRPKKA